MHLPSLPTVRPRRVGPPAVHPMRVLPLAVHPMRVVLLAVALSGCATPSKVPPDPSGTYRFEAWSGDRAHTGVLDIRGVEGEWTGSIWFEYSGLADLIHFEIEDGALRLTAEGPDSLIRVNAHFSGSRLSGTWSSRNQGGRFRAEKQGWRGT